MNIIQATWASAAAPDALLLRLLARLDHLENERRATFDRADQVGLDRAAEWEILDEATDAGRPIAGLRREVAAITPRTAAGWRGKAWAALCELAQGEHPDSAETPHECPLAWAVLRDLARA